CRTRTIRRSSGSPPRRTAREIRRSGFAACAAPWAPRAATPAGGRRCYHRARRPSVAGEAIAGRAEVADGGGRGAREGRLGALPGRRERRVDPFIGCQSLHVPENGVPVLQGWSRAFIAPCGS